METVAAAARRGVVLVGGRGTRLFPLTAAVNKHLLGVYDLPVVCFPLATLLEADVRDVLIVGDPGELPAFERVLGRGERFAMSLAYVPQPEPRGVAHAIGCATPHLEGRGSVVALGDTFLRGAEPALRRALARSSGATILATYVDDVAPFGTVALDAAGRPRALREKPPPGPGLAVPGLYVYDTELAERLASLRPSARGELEVSDLNAAYLAHDALHVERLADDVVWLDLGTADALLEAAALVAADARRGAPRAGCLEELAFRRGHLQAADLASIASGYPPGPHRERLLELSRG